MLGFLSLRLWLALRLLLRKLLPLLLMLLSFSLIFVLLTSLKLLCDVLVLSAICFCQSCPDEFILFLCISHALSAFSGMRQRWAAEIVPGPQFALHAAAGVPDLLHHVLCDAHAPGNWLWKALGIGLIFSDRSCW